MHYVLIAAVIIFYIYFRFGKKPLGYVMLVAAVLALLRGLIVLAIPAAIIAYFVLRNEKLNFPPLGDKGTKGNAPVNNRQQDDQQSKSPGVGQPALIAPSLAIFLDPDNGDISGVVRKGALEDKPLTQLSREELKGLYEELFQHDKESLELLIAYLDTKVKGWRDEFGLKEGKEQNPLGQSKSLMPRDALINLGLPYAADEADIKKAHRQLMKKFHPDQGGSPYLAARLNMAKDVLLKHSPKRRR